VPFGLMREEGLFGKVVAAVLKGRSALSVGPSCPAMSEGCSVIQRILPCPTSFLTSKPRTSR
jgi:hypothetical protein